MERKQKKDEQRATIGMSSMQIAKVIGNQAAQIQVVTQRMPRMYTAPHPFVANHQEHHIIPNSVLVGCINDFMGHANLLQNISIALEGAWNRINLPVGPNQHYNQTLPGHGGNHPVYNTEVENRIAGIFGAQGQLVTDYLVNGVGAGTAIRGLAAQLNADIHNLTPNDTLDDI